MKRNVVLVFAYLLLLLHSLCYATVWYVHPDSALNSIQTALNGCSAGDTVLVGPGTYYENIVWPYTQGLNLQSEYGADTTIIDGDSAASVVRIVSGIDSTTVIQGFTLSHGYDDYGGGIDCGWYSNSTPMIINNIISDNTAIYGGGIACFHATPIVIGNIIVDNVARSDGLGGGILCVGVSPLIRDNSIIGNTANTGGGIYCDNSSPTLINDTISMNTAGYSGAVHCFYYSSLIIDSCTISYNQVGIRCENYSSPVVHYSNISSNTVGLWNQTSIVIDAENNWWGDPTGPYHQTLNPGGLGNSVMGSVDFDPWLSWPVGVEEQPIAKPIEKQNVIATTIFRGPLQIPEGKKCKIFDITGMVVEPSKIQPGIYFIEVDGVMTQKVVKVR